MNKYIIACVLIAILFGHLNSAGFKLRGADDAINVHIVAHTHDDAGWLATMDEYYYGINGMGKCVKCILDNMVISLNADKKRTFTYVEMAFFEKWYSELDEQTKMTVRNFVKEGRLDFANGGWVMNDEATAQYQHIVDQMRIGMLFLKKEFDYTPRVAWYLDPFGHSLTNAYLLSKLGFDKLVMVRIDFREKEKRIKDKTMEFVWRPYYEIDQGKSSILTHITHGHYSPDGDRFPDMLERDFSDPSYFTGRLDQIFEYFKDMSDAYPTKELLFLYGDDFTFKNANQNFRNIEALMEAFQKNDKYKNKINFFYSTPKKYFEKLDEKLGSTQLSTLDGVDFFPYSEYKWDYWTGYFSSRPYLKGLVRDAGAYLQQTSDMLLAHIVSGKIGDEKKKLIEEMYALRRELAIAQHHDAVSGTAREAVSQDYIHRLNKGISEVTNGLKMLIEKDLNFGLFDSICIEAVSQSECNLKVYEKNKLEQGLTFAYINPGIEGSYPVKIKVEANSGVKVTDLTNNKELVTDLICDSELNHCVVNTLVEFSKSKLYSVVKLEIQNDYPAVTPSTLSQAFGAITLLENEDTKLTFTPKNMLFTQKVKQTGDEYSISIDHGFYTYNWFNDPIGKNRQGAYLLATDEETPTKLQADIDKSKYFIGKQIAELDLVYEKSKLKIRFYPTIKNANFIFDTESILFPNHPSGGLEFVLIVNSCVKNLNSDKLTEFFTDTNGMKMIKRIKDTRQNFEFKVDDTVASNFYPVNSVLSLIGQNNLSLHVFNDRAQAGTSLKQGEVYMIMNRWSQRDDRKGLADGIDESNSSNINFHVNHWIAITQDNFDKNYLSDLINKKPVHAIYTDQRDLLSEEMSKLIIKHLETFKLPIDSLFEIEDKDCIEYDFYFISEKEVLVQFMNKLDPYFYQSKDCKVMLKEKSDLIEKVEKVGLNGIDIITNGKKNAFITKSYHGFTQTFLKFSSDVSSISSEIRIKPLDFETFYFTLKN